MPVRMTFRDIANDLAARIRNGEYPPGSLIPSYADLADLYSVSTATAYRAVSLLTDRGLVRGEQGRGVFVVEAPESS